MPLICRPVRAKTPHRPHVKSSATEFEERAASTMPVSPEAASANWRHAAEPSAVSAAVVGADAGCAAERLAAWQRWAACLAEAPHAARLRGMLCRSRASGFLIDHAAPRTAGWHLHIMLCCDTRAPGDVPRETCIALTAWSREEAVVKYHKWLNGRLLNRL